MASTPSRSPAIILRNVRPLAIRLLIDAQSDFVADIHGRGELRRQRVAAGKTRRGELRDVRGPGINLRRDSCEPRTIASSERLAIRREAAAAADPAFSFDER